MRTEYKAFCPYNYYTSTELCKRVHEKVRSQLQVGSNFCWLYTFSTELGSRQVLSLMLVTSSDPQHNCNTWGISSLVPKLPPFLPSICIQNNTRERNWRRPEISFVCIHTLPSIHILETNNWRRPQTSHTYKLVFFISPVFWFCVCKGEIKTPGTKARIYLVILSSHRA